MAIQVRKKIHKKIEYLNEAAIQMDNAVKKIKRAYPDDQDVDVLLYRIQKTIGELHSLIIKRLQKEVDEEAFNDAIKGFEIPLKPRQNIPPKKRAKKRK